MTNLRLPTSRSKVPRQRKLSQRSKQATLNMCETEDIFILEVNDSTKVFEPQASSAKRCSG